MLHHPGRKERDVEWIEGAPARGMLVVLKPDVGQVLDDHGVPLPDASSGLEVSRGSLTLEGLRTKLGLDVSIGTLHQAMVNLRISFKKTHKSRRNSSGPMS